MLNLTGLIEEAHAIQCTINAYDNLKRDVQEMLRNMKVEKLAPHIDSEYPNVLHIITNRDVKNLQEYFRIEKNNTFPKHDYKEERSTHV